MLFVLRPALLGSAHFTLPRVQIVIGVLALLVAAVLASGLRLPRSRDSRHDCRPGSGGWPTAVRRGWRRWPGLGIALPSVDYLAALAVILASGAAAPTQVAALLTFNVVAFALVEIPLVAYLVAPERTRRVDGRAARLAPVAPPTRRRRPAGR